MDPVSQVSKTVAAQAAVSRAPVQTLGQDEFIKILVAQLTTQDPLNPQKDAEFIGQMAQFSQLESSKLVTAELTAMRTQQDFLKANSLIGRRVQIEAGPTDFIGTVSGVAMKNGEPLIEIGDQQFELADVVRVDQGTGTVAAPK